MHTDSYFDHLSICDNDFDVLTRLVAGIIPEINQKVLENHLREKYSDLPSLLSTSFTALRSDNVIGESLASVLKLFHILMLRHTKAKIRGRDLIANIEDLNHYLLEKMSLLKEEHILLLLLSSKNFLIKEEIIATGTVNHTAFHPKSIIEKVVTSAAAAFIIVHNHPSGDPTPSTNDIRTSKELAEICDRLNIAFHDHVIVGADRVRSMRKLGLLAI